MSSSSLVRNRARIPRFRGADTHHVSLFCRNNNLAAPGHRDFTRQRSAAGWASHFLATRSALIRLLLNLSARAKNEAIARIRGACGAARIFDALPRVPVSTN